jgi:hypothetical protein
MDSGMGYLWDFDRLWADSVVKAALKLPGIRHQVCALMLIPITSRSNEVVAQ